MATPATTTTTMPRAPQGVPRTPVLVPARSWGEPAPGLIHRAARRLVVALLGRMTAGRLTIYDQGRPTTYGRAGDPLGATIRILDERAWTAVVREGSIGFGRGYLEGWWDTDDPATVVRVIIANLQPLQPWQARKAGLARLRPQPWRRGRRQRQQDREDIAAHYDIGTDFFSLFLDETLTYSSGVFVSPDATMAEASAAKYDRLLDKLGVRPGDEVLEIGSGWGGFALHAARTRGCRVTTTTISADQFDEASRRVVAAGLSHRIELLNRDWRDLTGRYDKIVSVEMIEAVDWRDYTRFFAVIDRCLAPEGVAALQAICVPGQRYGTARNTEDFIKRFVFPGGGLPSLGAIVDSVSATDLQVLDIEDFSAHYAETLRRWAARFEQQGAGVDALGFDRRFRRLWRFYLAYCEAAFDERHCTVNQLVLVGPRWRPDGLELRPH